MTRQKIFNKVAKHLLTQNRQARNDTGDICMLYRAPNGTRCAIGCLIPDDKYDPSMEGLGISGIVFKFGLTELIPDENRHDAASGLSFLRRLQLIHDSWVPADWRGQLSHYAAVMHLSPAVIKKF